MNVFDLRKKVIEDYARYVQSFVAIRDQRIEALVKEELEGGFLWPEPLLQLNPAFEPGLPMRELVAQGLLHPECLKIFAIKEQTGPIGPPIRLHEHQVAGIRAAQARDHYILTTGTGSGKSLAYIVPIVDHVLRKGSGRGIQAIIVYPMNALANSQMGELEKFLGYGYGGRPPVTFRRYTGQEKDAERREILANPPDILLTNYVMLELVLTRTDETALVNAAKGLQFLVLDELHTYRGRQGADVSLLVRRVREACEADGMLCIGTSATLASADSWSKQQVEVARVASSLFGAEVLPERIIGETLRRVTPSPPDDRNEFFQAIRACIEMGNDPPTENAITFARHPLVIWLESNLGLREDPQTGRLVRGAPRPLFGIDGAATQLAKETGLPAEDCAAAIQRALLAGHRCTHEGRPIFAFRLHQFVSKGECVYASLDPEESRHLTLEAQQFVPGKDRESILLPLAFCRECGQEYYMVRRVHEASSGRVRYTERGLSDRLDDAHGGIPGYLYLDTKKPWPTADSADFTRRLPETWLDVDSGRPVVKKSLRDRLPREVFVSPDGIEGQGHQRVHFVPSPFRFCLHCGVAYEARPLSDFGKLSTLGTEGRSTATTILSLSTLEHLRQDGSLDKEAQKLLSFTDNRQDASLQAGHFNDFIEIGLLRSAVHRAVLAASSAGIPHDVLPMRVFDALALPLSLYASNPDVEYAQREATDRALRNVLGYYLYRDLQRGWRITSPNLEQCGQLDIDYVSLDTLCADEKRWQKLHAALASASPSERANVCRVLCDFMRRELAIRVDFLDPGMQEGYRHQSNQYLTSPWAFDENDHLEQSRIVFPGSRKDDKRPQPRSVYVSARGGFGRYLRRASTLPPVSSPLKMEDVEQIIRELLEILTVPGAILHRVVDAKRQGDVPGYQLNSSALIWRAGTGQRAFHDPVRVPNAPEQGLRVNPFFESHYRSAKDDSKYLHAHEHTAQVPSDKREEREEAFRLGRLPLLYCSPTMELGVDIRQLNVVNMRNVPPTPANYAQRSGRAGRSGQPAFVLTYCSSGSPHDQYFFRRPANMVAGAVAAPRLDLQNEDLVRAHVHAVWLAVARLNLKRSLSDVLDVNGDQPTLNVLPDVQATLENRQIREKAIIAAKKALGEVVRDLVDPGTSVDAWLERVLRELPRSFEQACERFRGLYRVALSQYKEQSKRAVDASRDAREREQAKSQASDAYKQLQLLLEQGSSQQSDFYSYRYFASEGFLPGYNFPRLPLVAYIKGRHRRGDTDEFLSRPRFLAISEFGPRSIIYHEGSKYEVKKVILPVEENGGALLQKGALCSACGYLHPLEASELDLCQRCSSKMPPKWSNLLRMQNVSTKRRARINSDEEERIRLGYEIKTGIRFAQRHGTTSAQTAILTNESGEALATLTYGHSATVWRMNLGWRRRQNKDELGYNLDMDRGYWAKNPDADDEDRDDPKATRVQRVIPYVEDHRNCLLIEPVAHWDVSVMASLEAALKAAIQVEFQVEDRELATEPLPSDLDRRILLFYEASEGGAGILRRLVEENGALKRVARTALEICHYEPGTLEDKEHAPRARETCESACYDCLRSYFNQRDHDLLDRKSLRYLLASWEQGTIDASPSMHTREEHKLSLLRLCQSDLERRWIELVDQLGLRLPTQAQALIEACNARPDFHYHEDNIAIFIDGPHHDTPTQRRHDHALDENLTNHGTTVIRFHHAADWEAIFARYPGLFGKPTAKSEPPPSRQSPIPDAPTETTYDPNAFDTRWHSLFDTLCTTPGLQIHQGEEIKRGGRLLGETIASVHRGAIGVHLLDATAKNISDLEAVLQNKGQRVLRIRPNLPNLVARVLAMLD